jgi:hypothetical protein
MRRVAERREKNPESPLWQQLAARWAALEGHARAVLAKFEDGQASNRHEVKAAHELLRLSEGAPVEDIIDCALAMYLMEAMEPRRFRSDRAFWAQLVRRVRGVADVSAGRRWDHQAGKVRRVYRELAPQASAVLRVWIVEAFGMAGLRLAELEERDLEAQRDERKELRDALGGLK